MEQELLTRLNDGSVNSQFLIGLIDMGVKGLPLMAAARLVGVAASHTGLGVLHGGDQRSAREV